MLADGFTMWPNATMSDTPEPPRPLRWPHGLKAGDFEDDEAVPDPEGRWMAEHADAAPARSIPAAPEGLSAIMRDASRWAPQHGARGRSDSALPGAFLPLETEPPPFHVPPGLLGPETSIEPETKRKSSALAREVIETVLLALLVFLAVRASVQHYRVEGQSMDPTLVDGEFLLVNSLIYSEVNIGKIADWVPYWDPGEPDVRHVFHGPERGDIIVFQHPQAQTHRDLVKRVIAIPGDTISIRDNAVFINGRQLVEPYVSVPRQDDMDEMVIPADHYFVMGDNRGNSLDSRSFGAIHEDLIVGKALASWWPRDHIGLAPNQEATYLDSPGTEAD